MVGLCWFFLTKWIILLSYVLEKIKSWITVSWLKMHLFGLNVSAMQFCRCLCFCVLLSFPSQGLGVLTLWLLGQVVLICREVQWWKFEIGKKGQELRDGDPSALQSCGQSSFSFCSGGQGWSCPMVPALLLRSSRGSHRLCAGIASDPLQLLS